MVDSTATESEDNGIISFKACLAENWEHAYKQWTLPTQLIPLPPDFLDYLLQDSILPTEIQLPISMSFPLFAKVLSCPKDASWINSNSLALANQQDLYLLLKSSQIISDNLAVLKRLELQPVLQLKPYKELNQSLEFRLFVRKEQLVGISQRYPIHFPFLIAQSLEYKLKIAEWFSTLPAFRLPSYCIDICILQSITILDISCWRSTDSLLFEWRELDGFEQLVFRVCKRDQESFSISNRVPTDIFDFDHKTNLFTHLGGLEVQDLSAETFGNE